MIDLAAEGILLRTGDLIISFLALLASWAVIIFLLKERSEKNRPYMQVSFEPIRSTLACIVLKNIGNSPIEMKSLKFSEGFIRQLPLSKQQRLLGKENAKIAIYPNRQWVISFDVNVFDILNKFQSKVVEIEYVYTKLGANKKFTEKTTIDFREYSGLLVYTSELWELKSSVDKLTSVLKKSTRK